MTTIRRMTAADAERAVAPIRESGWGDRRELFDLFLAIETCKPFVAVEGDDPVATGCAIVNGAAGWVGMIWVRPDRRGQGLGRGITERVCEELEAAGCETLVLIASPAGKPVYDRMGFRTALEYAVYEAPHLGAPPAPPPASAFRPIGGADLSFVTALDAAATGEDRSAIVRYLAPRGRVLADAATGDPRGFLLPTDEATGAILAATSEDALALLDLRRHLAPAFGRATVAASAEAHRAALEAAGWRHLFDSPRMIRGPEFAWRPELIWGILGFALG